MTTRITIQQLESYLWDAAVLLRGTIDAGDYKQFIMPLLFYKRLCDVFDEETQVALKESGGDTGYAAFPENHRFQIPPEVHWREIRKVSRDVGRHYRLLSGLSKLPIQIDSMAYLVMPSGPIRIDSLMLHSVT